MFRSAKKLLIALIAPLSLLANPTKDGIKATYLSVGGEAHTPISVRCSNDSTYTVTDSGLRIDTLVYPMYADDNRLRTVKGGLLPQMQISCQRLCQGNICHVKQ